MKTFLLALAIGLLSASGAMAQTSNGVTLFPPPCNGLLYWKSNTEALKCAGDIPTCLPGQQVRFSNGEFTCTGVGTTPGGGAQLSVSCPDGQYLAGIENGAADCRTLPAGGTTTGRTGPRELIGSATFSRGQDIAIPADARFVEIEGFCVQYRWNRADGMGFYGNDVRGYTPCMGLDVPGSFTGPGNSTIKLKVDPITTVLDIPVGPTKLHLTNMAKHMGNIELSEQTGKVRFFR